MALSDSEKTDVRRHCGYPSLGRAPTYLVAWPLTQSRGVLEFRMNNLSDAEEAVVRRYLASLFLMESAVPKSADNLDTDQAAIWSRNRTEQEDRIKLLDGWRRRLCAFLGVSAGPGLPTGGSIAVVV